MSGSRRLIDTNLIVRHLVQDHDQHAKAAAKLFDSCDRGMIALVLLPVVLAECVFVLESFYGRSRGEIADTLIALIGSPGIEVDHCEVYVDALNRYARTKLHFVDCAIAATAAMEQWAVATFDVGFKKFPDVRIEV